MSITIQTTVKATMDEIWSAWTTPDDITQWYIATEGWLCPKAELELKPEGRFCYRMEVHDGSMGFDFSGTFKSIETNAAIHYVLDDDRAVSAIFKQTEDGVVIEQTFEPESEFSAEQQKEGWQGILNRFKSYVEGK